MQGASTLTQQLAREPLHRQAPRTLVAQVEEACLALKLAEQAAEAIGSSTQYLNVVCYGNQAYGVAAAAQTYFSRRASQLSVVQAALIAGLPQAPTLYDPFRYPKAALARRNEVLDALLVDASA